MFKDTINQNSNLLLKLINDILELSRIKSGQKKRSRRYSNGSTNMIAERMKGDILISSTEDKGSRFTLMLPYGK